MIDTKALREKILDLAMRGKLVPQDSTDEPASELLKRIKAEKEQLIKDKKIRRDKNETEIFRSDDGLHYEKFQDGTVKEVAYSGEIPTNWEIARLNQIGLVFSGGTPKTNILEYYNGSIPWITPADMGNQQQDILFNKPIKHITELGLKKSSAQLITKNSIVFSSRAPIGHINIVPYEFSTNQGCKSFSLIDGNIFFYYFCLKERIADIQNRASGTTFKEISKKGFSDTLIPVPPPKEQERIAKVIKGYFILIDIIDQEQESLQQLSEQLKKKVLDTAMRGRLVPQDPSDEPASVLLEKIREEKQRLYEEGKLKEKDLEESIIYKSDDNSYYGSIPISWEMVTLNQIGIITSGGTPKTSILEYFDGNIPWITPAEMGRKQSSSVLKNPEKFISEKGLKNSSAQLIASNSIAFSSRAPIGHINIVPFDFTTNQGCKSVTPFFIDISFLYFVLKNSREQIESNASGTTFKEISRSKFSETVIPLAPLSEQKRISKYIHFINKELQKLSY